MSRTIATAILIALALGWIEPAQAGGAPPYQARINRLNAAEQNLDVIHARLVAVLDFPIDPMAPPPYLAGKLTAMGNQLDAIYGRVVAVLDLPIDPVVPPEFMAAVGGVRQGAADIVAEALIDVLDEDVRAALSRVAVTAQDIVSACDGILVDPAP